MKTKLLTALTISAMSLGLNACMMDNQRTLNSEPGRYENTTSSTDANGTKTVNESSTEVGVDSNGHKKAVTKSKTTTDPKGLFNKTTKSQTKQVIEE